MGGGGGGGGGDLMLVLVHSYLVQDSILSVSFLTSSCSRWSFYMLCFTPANG